MADREKVIKGLEEIVNSDWMWRKADYWALVCKDALALLKKYVYGTRYVPVVRCYECQYWEPNNAEEFATSGHCRKQYGMCENNVTDGTWFCSDGERDPDA